MKKKVFFNILFWTVSFSVLLRLFTKEYYNGMVDYIYTIVFHIPLILIVSLNYISIRQFFLSKQYVKYIISFLLLGLLGIFLHYLFFDYLAKFLIKGFYFISMPRIEVSQYMLGYLFVSLLYKLSLSWYDLKEKQIALEKENTETQLNNLKAQLNPHFLFNSLNNIYSLSNSDIDLSKEYIIKLSDSLRYMLYDTTSQKVGLNNELEYLNNYIELEKLRLEEEALVSYHFSGECDKYKIAPLILLPFVENCFKHCNKSKPHIVIEIKIISDRLTLKCFNNKAEKGNQVSHGLGLVNARKRLNMIYPDMHLLKISDDVNFEVNLELNLN